MAEYYKLNKARELADGDDEFLENLAIAFVEEIPNDVEKLKSAVQNMDYYGAYQAAHKMKPTIDFFELGILETLIEIQDWGKFEQSHKNIHTQLQQVTIAIEKATNQIKSDFNI